MANDILSQLLGGNKSTESQYYDILNRRTAMDDIGDAFTSQSTQPAINGKQKMTNALMAGVGAGFKASQTSIRDRKMQEVEAQLKQVYEQNMKLQSQLGETQLRKATLTNYAVKRKGDLKKLNDLYVSGDSAEFNELGGELFNELKRDHPELVGNMGDLLHMANGVAVFRKNGKNIAIDVKDAFEPLVNALPTDEDKEEVSGLLSLPIRRKIENKNFLEDLSLRDAEANITNKYAAANQANAHADYYRGETEKIQNQRMNPPKYDEKTAQHISKSNIDWVNQIHTEIKKSEKSAKAYEMTAKLLDEEAVWHGRGGNSLISAAQRLINFSGTDSAKNQALLEMYKLPLLEDFKYFFGNKATDTDLKTYLATLSTLDKDSIASSTIARERAKEISSNNRENQIRAKILEQKFKYGEPYNSQEVSDAVNKEMNRDLSGEGKAK